MHEEGAEKGGQLMAKRVHVVIQRHQVIDRSFTDRLKRVTVGVWIDLDELDELAVRAARNKSRKAKSGAVHVEALAIEPVQDAPLVACR